MASDGKNVDVTTDSNITNKPNDKGTELKEQIQNVTQHPTSK